MFNSLSFFRRNVVEAAEQAEAARREEQARLLREVEDTTERVEARFKPLGAVFTEWVASVSSTPDAPVYSAYFRFPESGDLYRAFAEHDGHTVHKL